MLTLHRNEHPLLFNLVNFLGSSCDHAWLVGGTVRDLLLKKQPADYDIAFRGDLTAEIRTWSRQNRGSWFWLDQDRNQSRVLLEGGSLQFDFVPLRAATIDQDLSLRDFTLNAIAVPLRELTSGAVIDPLGGAADLHAGRLRCCSAKVLKNDPLRCLKGVRHHAQNGWTFTPGTVVQIRAAAELLGQVAGERLRSELSYILSSTRTSSAICLLAETGLAQVLFPSFNENTFQAEFSRFNRRMISLLGYESLRLHLEEEYESLLSLRSLFVLTLILSCTAEYKPAMTERLRLSRRSMRLLESLLFAERRQIDFSRGDSPRVRALKVECLGSEPVARLLFTLLCRQTAELDEPGAAAVESYDSQIRQGRVPDLLGGAILAKQYPALSGKEVGDWLARLKAAEITGEISQDADIGPWLKQQFSD